MTCPIHAFKLGEIPFDLAMAQALDLHRPLVQKAIGFYRKTLPEMGIEEARCDVETAFWEIVRMWDPEDKVPFKTKLQCEIFNRVRDITRSVSGRRRGTPSWDTYVVDFNLEPDPAQPSDHLADRALTALNSKTASRISWAADEEGLAGYYDGALNVVEHFLLSGWSHGKRLQEGIRWTATELGLPLADVRKASSKLRSRIKKKYPNRGSVHDELKAKEAMMSDTPNSTPAPTRGRPVTPPPAATPEKAATAPATPAPAPAAAEGRALDTTRKAPPKPAAKPASKAKSKAPAKAPAKAAAKPGKPIPNKPAAKPAKGATGKAPTPEQVKQIPPAELDKLVDEINDVIVKQDTTAAGVSWECGKRLVVIREGVADGQWTKICTERVVTINGSAKSKSWIDKSMRLYRAFPTDKKTAERIGLKKHDILLKLPQDAYVKAVQKGWGPDGKETPIQDVGAEDLAKGVGVFLDRKKPPKPSKQLQVVKTLTGLVKKMEKFSNEGGFETITNWGKFQPDQQEKIRKAGKNLSVYSAMISSAIKGKVPTFAELEAKIFPPKPATPAGGTKS